MIEVGKEIKVMDPGKKLLHVQKVPENKNDGSDASFAMFISDLTAIINFMGILSWITRKP